MKLLKQRKYLIVFGCLPIFIIFFNTCELQKEKPDTKSRFETKLNPNAPKEMELLGQLIGSWDAEQTIINSDGTWNGKKSKAIWKWYYILDGQAIQDEWISTDSLNNKTAIGTNIRIYNVEENQWYMAWIDKTNRRLASFTAINNNGKVIMDGKNANGRDIKNTFFNISRHEFDWKQEWTFDEGKTWVEVAKIHCVRIRQ